MAQTATMYQLAIDLSDIDRGLYEKFTLRVARQPSETAEYMLVRILAYCLEYTEGIMLTEGVAAGSDPAVVVRDLTGRTTAWIEVGMPGAERLHRGSKLAGRAAIYTHRDIRMLKKELEGAKIHQAKQIPIYAFDRDFIEKAASLIDRRSAIDLSIDQRELFLTVGSTSLNTPIVEHRICQS